MLRKGTLTSAWICLVLTYLLLLAQPAYADPLFGFANFLVGAWLVSETLVIGFEGWYMGRMLGLPIRIALRWSLLANLVSAILGPVATLVLMGIPHWLGLDVTDLYAVISLPFISVLVAIALEYPILLLLNRKGATSRPLLKYCVYMNLISVPSAYLVVLAIAWVLSA